ncbi:hypothetical protein [Vibrio owensii]|uniref:hypothetical protein n=1 Tax=Vibrio harveyi group TaxID=717610 RepID=UPI003CC672C5
MSELELEQEKNVGTTILLASETLFNTILIEDVKRLVSSLASDIAVSLLSHLKEIRDVANLYDEISERNDIDLLASDYWVASNKEEEIAFLAMQGDLLNSYLDEAFQKYVSDKDRVELSYTSLRLRASGFAYRDLLKDSLSKWMEHLMLDFDESINKPQGIMLEIIDKIHTDDQPIEQLLYRHIDETRETLSVSFS